ncbi:putative RNA-binding protein 19 [Holothuria leucospilota]|uniref:RNA-binding protein 19 n=1 Tax=Holothuria leucospilota TaxID=206669 RepID=A0A9Q0YL68_HOLLE|nr:putative RNA-binding protein 19 [Holothuria leucospilota]
MTSEKLRGIFAAKGDITDLQLKYTKSGVFRRFAFIGFQSNAAARSAIDFFHNTFIDASRIQVEEAKDLTASEKPRPWSKYSDGSSAFKKKSDVKGGEKSKQKKDPGNSKAKESKKETTQTLGLDLGEVSQKVFELTHSVFLRLKLSKVINVEMLQ